jgi:hypothetical protein
LTHLSLSGVAESFDSLALALLECPSLTDLNISNITTQEREGDIWPVVQILHRLPLVKLTLVPRGFSDESIECVLSFLSQSSVQDLGLGPLTPHQLQLVVDALPSLPLLVNLRVGTSGFPRCEHEFSYLSLFSSLTKSPLRYLNITSGSFRIETLEKCLNNIPNTQLTKLRLVVPVVFAEGFDPNIHNPRTYKKVTWQKLTGKWSVRFPNNKDRFCFLWYS